MEDSIFKEIKNNDEKTEVCVINDGDSFIRMKESKTKRVGYCTNSHSFCFFDIEEDTKMYYDIQVDLNIHPAEVMLNSLYKLSTKKWYNIDVQKDFLDLFRYIIGEKEWDKISSYNS